MQYHFKVHEGQAGFWAQCIELPGCVTQANSRQELLANMQTALNLYILGGIDLPDLAPLTSNRRVGKNVIMITLEA